jgi:hypothetical protein
MGFDINVYLINGFKIPLHVAFEYNLLNREIMNSDDYQLIDEPECKRDIIERNVKSDILKELLLNYDYWNLYILTSSQIEMDEHNSYLFLYDTKTICSQGTPPDYATDIVPNEIQREWSVKNILSLPSLHYLHNLTKIELPPPFEWHSELHWVVESSR